MRKKKAKDIYALSSAVFPDIPCLIVTVVEDHRWLLAGVSYFAGDMTCKLVQDPISHGVKVALSSRDTPGKGVHQRPK